MDSPVCSIFFHNYYGQHESWIRYFSEKITVPFTLFYHIVENSLYNQPDCGDPGHLTGKLNQFISGPWLKRIVLRRSPNQGKDIGGKMVLMDSYIRERHASEYILLLHDKKSPYKVQGEAWRDKLFRITGPEFVRTALAAFDKNKEIGIIAGTDSINNEYDPTLRAFSSNNGPQLTRLLAGYNIFTGEPVRQDYRYVAGTMFWSRSAPLLEFFSRHAPLDIRKTLESGNIMDENQGSNTHAWERLLSWLTFAEGYTIQGL